MGKNKKKLSTNNQMQNNNLENSIVNKQLQQNDTHNVGKYAIGVEYNGPVIMIPPNEYQALLNDNERLRKEIQILTNNEQILHEVILDKDKTINELREENKKLREKLESLEKQIDVLSAQSIKQEKEYNELKTQHIILNKNHNALKDDHNELKNQFTKMMNKQMFDKYIIAIQDLNKLENLETKLDSQTQKKLYKLKSNRIHECHYLDNLDSPDLIDDKRTILNEKIINMPLEIKTMFNKMYPELLNKIAPFIVNTKTTPSQQTIDNINYWWEF
jgi:hypothetical protein